MAVSRFLFVCLVACLFVVCLLVLMMMVLSLPVCLFVPSCVSLLASATLISIAEKPIRSTVDKIKQVELISRLQHKVFTKIGSQ